MLIGNVLDPRQWQELFGLTTRKRAIQLWRRSATQAMLIWESEWEREGGSMGGSAMVVYLRALARGKQRNVQQT